MKMSELQGQTAEELQKQLLDLRKEQFKLRLQKGTGQLSQTHHVSTVRKDIARVKTQMSKVRSKGSV